MKNSRTIRPAASHHCLCAVVNDAPVLRGIA